MAKILEKRYYIYLNSSVWLCLLSWGEVLNQEPRVVGVPVWLSRLRIWHCHYSGLGHYIDMGSIPGLGTSTCHGCDPKMKQSKTKTKKEPRRVEWKLFFLPYTCKYHSEIGINHQPMPKKWMNLICILLSERIQSEEVYPVWLHLYDILEQVKQRR